MLISKDRKRFFLFPLWNKTKQNNIYITSQPAQGRARFLGPCICLNFPQVLSGRLMINDLEVQVHTETQSHFKKESKGFVQGREQWICSVRHTGFANRERNGGAAHGAVRASTLLSAGLGSRNSRRQAFSLKKRQLEPLSVCLVNSSRSHVREWCPLYTGLHNIFPFQWGDQERQPCSWVISINIPSLDALSSTRGSSFLLPPKIFCFPSLLSFPCCFKKDPKLPSCCP